MKRQVAKARSEVKQSFACLQLQFLFLIGIHSCELMLSTTSRQTPACDPVRLSDAHAQSQPHPPRFSRLAASPVPRARPQSVNIDISRAAILRLLTSSSPPRSPTPSQLFLLSSTMKVFLFASCIAGTASATACDTTNKFTVKTHKKIRYADSVIVSFTIASSHRTHAFLPPLPHDFLPPARSTFAAR